ncbi:uncharacterized protein LOC134197754 [Corticium candelabrum]|uniref:uncharacterized protein LOC134197754 n=1 Tax=Corticium candelabrum TaxID=121492 RepID=UPI002E27528A|nr:uncharacterized protein LOC134197754 [Corticium candelabrum]
MFANFSSSTIKGRSIRELTRQECGRLKFPSVSPEQGQVITVPRSTLFSNPHTSTVMPSESVCRRLAGKINQDCDCKDEIQAAGFLFGVFDLDGIREFLAIHEAKSIASQVNMIDARKNTLFVVPTLAYVQLT